MGSGGHGILPRKEMKRTQVRNLWPSEFYCGSGC